MPPERSTRVVIAAAVVLAVLQQPHPAVTAAAAD
jgi:hypothetical protein